MKSLTLIQPWASLIACGAKRIETRSWKTSYRGLLAIHAGKKVDAGCFENPLFREALQTAGIQSPDDLPRGVILAIANLHQCIETDGMQGRWGREYVGGASWHLTERERAFGDYSPGRYAWLLNGIRPLRTPILMKGALNLLTLPDELAAQVGMDIARQIANRPIPI